MIWFTKQNLISLAILAFLLGTYFLLLAHPVNLVTADLGRHIRNGEQFVSSLEIIKTNFYSYTHPDFLVTNHHWGVGVIFYLLWAVSGIAGVQVFFIAISLATFLVFYQIARRYVSTEKVAIIGLLVLPLLSQRTELRPEVLSYLFSGLFIYFLIRFRAGEISYKKLWPLILFQILWVNSHIYFFLGISITGAFLLESLILRKKSQYKILFGLIIFLIGASMVNPFGLTGAFAPLKIFDNFGYKLYENQTPFFIENLFPERSFLGLKVIFSILVLSFVGLMVRSWRKIDPAMLFLSIGFSVMALAMIRNHTLFGFALIPILAINASSLSSRWRRTEGEVERKSWLTLGLLVVVFLLTFSGEMTKVVSYNPDFGLGQIEGNNSAIEFFKNQNIQGPIFNNYDNGGYLIFGLFPEEKVFVDNRPEAYPSSFFTDVYIPMQQDSAVWKEQLEKHDFNTIFFSYRDFTPWGQKFLSSRVQDPEWSPVFVDDFSIIFLRRNDKNEFLIEQFEIPKQKLINRG